MKSKFFGRFDTIPCSVVPPKNHSLNRMDGRNAVSSTKKHKNSLNSLVKQGVGAFSFYFKKPKKSTKSEKKTYEL